MRQRGGCRARNASDIAIAHRMYRRSASISHRGSKCGSKCGSTGGRLKESRVTARHPNISTYQNHKLHQHRQHHRHHNIAHSPSQTCASRPRSETLAPSPVSHHPQPSHWTTSQHSTVRAHPIPQFDWKDRLAAAIGRRSAIRDPHSCGGHSSLGVCFPTLPFPLSLAHC